MRGRIALQSTSCEIQPALYISRKLWVETRPRVAFTGIPKREVDRVLRTRCHKPGESIVNAFHLNRVNRVPNILERYIVREICGADA
jgi:hypothetical protein